MITEPTLTIERKGFDAYSAKNFLHILMLAEPGWVIPAGRFERRYAALKENDKHRGDRAYFKALNRQMTEGGVEAMFYDLQKVALEDWHPREIPETPLHGGALAEQQTLTLPPWEQWYLSLLRDGKLPGGLSKKPNAGHTNDLLESVKERIPRLKFDASEITLREFLMRMDCTKHRDKFDNGWSFPPLAIARAEWDKAYGAQKWDNLDAEWGDKAKTD